MTIPWVKSFDSRGPDGDRRVEKQLAIAESVGHAGKQLPDFALGDVHEQTFGDDQRRPAGRYLFQPSGIGHRRADHAVRVGLVVQLAPELDNTGLIQVEPLHGRRWLDPQCPGVQPAAEVQHNRVGVPAQEILCPVVELLGSQRDQILRAPRLRGSVHSLEVVVDALDGLCSCVVPQNRAR